MDRRTEDRLHLKLDDIASKQNDMNAILAVNVQDLKTHMKRTEQLEVRVDKTESWITQVKGAHKLVILIGLVLSITIAVTNAL
mgnify:CR=1 FL=1|tara:strand:+ start:199 stop:447 length:249 start_codon:yes stop_codon:yes gene_type:complete